MCEKRKIEIPEELDRVVTESLLKVEKIHKKRIIKRTVLGLAACAAAITVFLIWGFQNPVLASKIPLVGGIFAQVEDQITFSGDYSEKALPLEKKKQEDILSCESQGIQITASEVYSDSYSIYLTLELKSKESLGDMAKTYTSTYGETSAAVIQVMEGNLSGSHLKEQDLLNQEIQGIQLDEHTYQGVMKWSVPQTEKPFNEDFTLELSLKELFYWDNSQNERRTINGDWKLKLPVTVDKENVQEYPIGQEQNGCSIEKVIVSPYEVRVFYQVQPLYADEEEVHQAKMQVHEESIQWAQEYGESYTQKTPDEVDSDVSITLSKDQGLAVFDQEGKPLEFADETYQITDSAIEELRCAVYATKNHAPTELHLYIGEDAIACIKETDESTMAGRALFATTLKL